MVEQSSTVANPGVDPLANFTKEKKFFVNKKHVSHLLPEHGYVYFDHLKAEYFNQLNDNVIEKIPVSINNIIAKRNDSSLTWSDVYTFESVLLRLLDDNNLPRKVWDLRNRYRDIVGLKDYEAYLASKPPEITGQVEVVDLRADIEFLLNKIYLNYSLAPFNEKMRSSISKKVTIMVLIGLFLIILTGLMPLFPITEISDGGHSATIFIVLFAGAMGGLMSMLQRYSNVVREGDPIESISMQSWYQIFIPAINGALFAALLYIIIVGTLIDGIIFPEMKGGDAAKNGISITEFLTKFKPENEISYAKLIVWSFIAGFAERFVPDTLTKIISKKEKEKDVKNLE